MRRLIAILCAVCLIVDPAWAVATRTLDRMVWPKLWTSSRISAEALATPSGVTKNALLSAKTHSLGWLYRLIHPTETTPAQSRVIRNTWLKWAPAPLLDRGWAETAFTVIAEWVPRTVLVGMAAWKFAVYPHWEIGLLIPVNAVIAYLILYKMREGQPLDGLVLAGALGLLDVAGGFAAAQWGWTACVPLVVMGWALHAKHVTFTVQAEPRSNTRPEPSPVTDKNKKRRQRVDMAIALITLSLVALNYGVLKPLTGLDLPTHYRSIQQAGGFIAQLFGAGIAVFFGTVAQVAGMLRSDTDTRRDRLNIFISFVLQIIFRAGLGYFTTAFYWWLSGNQFGDLARPFMSMAWGITTTAIYFVPVPFMLNRLDAWRFKRQGRDIEADALRKKVTWAGQLQKNADATAGRIGFSYGQQTLVQDFTRPENRVFTIFSTGFYINLFTATLTFNSVSALSPLNVFLLNSIIAELYFIWAPPLFGWMGLGAAVASAAYFHWLPNKIEALWRRPKSFATRYWLELTSVMTLAIFTFLGWVNVKTSVCLLILYGLAHVPFALWRSRMLWTSIPSTLTPTGIFMLYGSLLYLIHFIFGLQVPMNPILIATLTILLVISVNTMMHHHSFYSAISTQVERARQTIAAQEILFLIFTLSFLLAMVRIESIVASVCMMFLFTLLGGLSIVGIYRAREPHFHYPETYDNLLTETTQRLSAIGFPINQLNTLYNAYLKNKTVFLDDFTTSFRPMHNGQQIDFDTIQLEIDRYLFQRIQVEKSKEAWGWAGPAGLGIIASLVNLFAVTLRLDMPPGLAICAIVMMLSIAVMLDDVVDRVRWGRKIGRLRVVQFAIHLIYSIVTWWAIFWHLHNPETARLRRPLSYQYS